MSKAKAKGSKQREPSQASLRDIPQIDFSKASVRRNPYAARIAKEGITIQVGRGRPKKLPGSRRHPPPFRPVSRRSVEADRGTRQGQGHEPRTPPYVRRYWHGSRPPLRRPRRRLQLTCSRRTLWWFCVAVLTATGRHSCERRRMQGSDGAIGVNRAVDSFVSATVGRRTLPRRLPGDAPNHRRQAREEIARVLIAKPEGEFGHREDALAQQLLGAGDGRRHATIGGTIRPARAEAADEPRLRDPRDDARPRRARGSARRRSPP